MFVLVYKFYFCNLLNILLKLDLNFVYVLNLTNNPIRRINMDSILMGLPTGLHRIVLSYDRDYISDEEIRNFENFVHGISPEVMIDYHPINMEYI